MDSYILIARGVAETLAPIALVFIFLAVATKRARVVQAVRHCWPETRTNLGLILVNYILLAPVLAVPAVAVAAAIPGLPLAPFWQSLPNAIVLALGIVLIDFAAYWRHRLEHDAALWRFHATHHADERIHWLTVLRKHPVSKLIAMLSDSVLLILLGFPLWVIVAANLLRTWWGFFIHADVPWTLGPIGRVLISPAAHRLHHIRDEALMGANYGNTVTLWDKLFGTYVDPAPYLGCETGIAEGSRGLWGELARPWERRYRERSQGLGQAKV